MNRVRHGRSATFETKSSYCRAKVEFNSINLVRYGNSTTFDSQSRQEAYRKSNQNLSEKAVQIFKLTVFAGIHVLLSVQLILT